jgi:hypothetical protein
MKINFAKALRIARFVFVPTCIIAAIYAIHRNPSFALSQEKLTYMQLTMKKLLSNGEQVIYQRDLAKFGGAWSSRIIDEKSLTQHQKEEERKTLLSLGWKPIDNSSNQFCMNGIFLKFGEDIDSHEGKEVISIQGSFTARTVVVCK